MTFWDRVDKTSTCWVWSGWKNDKGYGLLTIRGVRRRAHRYVFELFGFVVPKDKVILHKCDNRACVRPSHLTIGTQKENMHDCIKKGRHVCVKRKKRSEDRLFPRH